MSSSNRLNRLVRGSAQALLGVLVAGILVACGGGGGDKAGTPIFQDPTTPTPTTPSALSDLAVVADKATIPNSGLEVVTYTVTALGAGNSALIGAETPVTVEVDAGAVVTPSSKTTDKTNAKLTAVVSLIDKTSRTVTLTAKSGSVTKKLSFNVVDSVTGSAVADLSVVVDKPTIPNTGAEEASITVTTLDATRSAVGGVVVDLQVVDVGDAVILDPDKKSTSAETGQLTRRLKLQNNKTKRTIAVKAVSGTVSRTITVDVVDPPTGTVLTASDLTLAISKNSVNNSGSETVDVVARAVDANRNALAGIEVFFKVDSGVLIPINLKTDAKGEARATVGIGADRTVRTITVTAKTSTLPEQKRLLEVTGARLQAVVNQASLNVGDAGTVEYTLVDINGAPIDGVKITAVGPGSETNSGNTDLAGKWVYNFRANGSGKMSILATGGIGDKSVESFVNVASIPPPLSADVQILSATMTMDPIVVSTGGTTQIRFLFRGVNNAPIPNVRVIAGLGPNLSSTDGKVSMTDFSKPLLSDKNGQAFMTFTAGERESPTEGVTIYGCYGRGDPTLPMKIVDAPAAPAKPTGVTCENGSPMTPVKLTVVEKPVSITIGGDDGLSIGETALTYVAKFTVLVVDSAGNPKSDVQVTPMIDLLGYAKGFYVYDELGKKWCIPNADGSLCYNPKSLPRILSCPNEDRLDPDGFRNGTIESGEDVNSNLQLDPRKSDVSIAMVGSTKTDKNGLATLRIEYPKSMANWVRYMIKVSAPGVLSPPAWYGRFEERWLPTLTSAIKSESDPAFRVSPYGYDITGYPGSTDPSAVLAGGCRVAN